MKLCSLFNYYFSINFMEDKSKQKQKDQQISKMQRLLSVHSLEGLVYEKRQRKQTVNQFCNILQIQHQKKKASHHVYAQPKDKKQAKVQKREQKNKPSKSLKNLKAEKRVSDSNQRELNQSNEPVKKRGRPRKSNAEEKEKGKTVIIKKQCRDKIQKVKPQQSIQEQPNSDKLSSQSQQQSLSSYSAKKHYKNRKIGYRKGKSILKEPQITNLKKAQLPIQQKQKEALQHKNMSQVQNYQINKEAHQLQNQTWKQNQNYKEKQKEKRLQPQKPKVGFKKFTQPSQHILPIKQGYQQKSGQKLQKDEPQQIPQLHNTQQINFLSEPKNQKINNIQLKQYQQNIDEEKNGLKLSSKRFLRIRRKNIDHLQQADIIRPPQEQKYQQIENNDRKRKTRLRKTKDEALKKFVMFEAESQEQYVENYETKKKKAGNDKQYMINRIFRKTQKADLANVKLEVDITKFPLQKFAEKIKVFDLVHCSLPLEMLIKLPNIASLITKGFIFIWVEKGQIQMGYHWLNRIGFDVIDQIMWVKTNQTMNQVVIDEDTTGEIFPNCRSTCLVGYKCLANQKTEYCTKISNNIIFSPAKPSSIEKPEQIFEIGDLMMPGARKLQLGEKQLGGWFTLKHRQSSLSRCHFCLRRDFRQLYMTESKAVICDICHLHQQKQKGLKKLQEIVNSDRKQLQQQESIQIKADIPDISKLYRLEFVQKKYFQSIGMICQRCNHKGNQLIQTFEHQQGKMLVCRECFDQQVNNKIRVFSVQQVYFPKKTVKCSNCQKQSLCKHYFECFSCKEGHIMCSNCFLEETTKIQIDQSKSQDSKHHDCKLKLLHEFPEEKASCFYCKQQCAIPYSSCEICQNFYWCGKCKQSQPSNKHVHHCHFNRQHHLALIF